MTHLVTIPHYYLIVILFIGFCFGLSFWPLIRFLARLNDLIDRFIARIERMIG